ncbi:DoxX family protein [Streptomyces fulvorobeus]|uniref:Integral membrane protein n=1 Tax=Streptomyces fulvorobeus TaxID=284028 RepID=A0A7J0C4F7_9ACTN|nr:DoxX family protein [Streptomyces fulvorobeus]NYE40520.1 putative oxidoreductase [Streptomyces fulvorobeus]GFM96813.1 integral membrane protein [Streptomyces fulvorobeus]
MSLRLDQGRPYALAAFRVVVGFLFACRGAASLFGVLGGDSVSTATWPGWYAAVIQLVGGILVVLGLGTRIAAFVASGSMAYAYFTTHQGEALFPLQNGGELSAMFCWAFFLLVFTGPGALAADALHPRGGSAQDAGHPREKAAAVTA